MPEELQRVVLKCLEKEADDRYQAAENLVSDFRELSMDAGSGSRASVTQQAAESGKKSKRPLLIAVAAALLIAVASYFGYEFTKTESIPDNSVAIMYIENQTGEAAYDRLAQNLIPQVYRQLFSAHNNVTQISPSLKRELEALQKAATLDKIAIGRMLDDAGTKYRVTAGIQTSGVGLDFLLEMTKPGKHPLVWQETIIKPDSVSAAGFAQTLAGWVEACVTIDAIEDSLHAAMNFPDNVTSRTVFKNWIGTKDLASKYFYQGLYLHDIESDESRAIPFHEKAVQIDPRCAGAWAWGTWGKGNLRKVVETQKWLDQWQQSGVMQSSRAEQLLFQHLKTNSVRAPVRRLKYLLELMQYEAFPYYWNMDIGIQYEQVGDFENSALYMKKSMDIGLTPHATYTYRALQNIYNVLGKWDDALHALEVGLERNSTNRRWRLDDQRLMGSMIRQHLMLGNIEKADEWFEKYQAISKRAAVGSARAHVVYGDHYLVLGDFDKADENYTKALSEIDLSAEQIRTIANSYVGMNKIAKAQEILLEAEKRYPKNIRNFRKLSFLFRTKQEYEKAIEYGEKATALDSSDDLHLMLAKALFHDANSESLQAKADWQSLIDRYKKPLNTATHPGNFYQLGCIYALKGDVEAALQILESAFEKGYRNHGLFLYDPDLDNVRNDVLTKKGFAVLLEKVKASYPAIARNKGAAK